MKRKCLCRRRFSGIRALLLIWNDANSNLGLEYQILSDFSLKFFSKCFQFSLKTRVITIPFTGFIYIRCLANNFEFSSFYIYHSCFLTGSHLQYGKTFTLNWVVRSWCVNCTWFFLFCGWTEILAMDFKINCFVLRSNGSTFPVYVYRE